MTNWKVAPSYKYAKILSVNEDTHKACIEEKCDRCGGSGIIAARIKNNRIIPIPVDGGVCYKCEGVGVIKKWVKAYTEDEYNKYIASQERTKARKAEAEEIRKQNLINNSEANKKALLEKFGYNPENPMVYLVSGENTYAVKDELKAAGAHFQYTLGWYFNQETQVPEGYTLVAVDFNTLFDWNPLTKKIELKENAKETAEAAISATMPKSTSEYIGEIKERMRDMKVTLTAAHNINSFYGTSTIYTFNYNGNVLVWITSSYQNIEVGEEILLTGTVKAHDEYKGVKQTKLSRCIIKKEE